MMLTGHYKVEKIESNESANTIADGLKTQLGDINFPIIQKYVDHIIRVTEQEIVHALRLIWERMKIIVEPSSAVALAAVLKAKENFQKKRIGIIVSGGNVDLGQTALLKNQFLALFKLLVHGRLLNYHCRSA